MSERSVIFKKALIETLKYTSLYIDNGLNQPVTIQVKANRIKEHAKSVSVGSAFTVPASSQDARSLSLETSGWLPWIMVEAKCDTAPTSGSLTVYRVRDKLDQLKLVDALEIRDTTWHTPTTDPTKILIQEW